MHQFVGAAGVHCLSLGVRRRMKFHQLLWTEGAHAGKLLPQNLNRFGDVLLPGSIPPPFGQFIHSRREVFQAVAEVVGILRLVSATDGMRLHHQKIGQGSNP